MALPGGKSMKERDKVKEKIVCEFAE